MKELLREARHGQPKMAWATIVSNNASLKPWGVVSRRNKKRQIIGTPCCPTCVTIHLDATCERLSSTVCIPGRLHVGLQCELWQLEGQQATAPGQTGACQMPRHPT